MFDIEMHEPSEDFLRCFNSAGLHIQSLTADLPGPWLKATPTPPFLEHLSFSIGNQLFFVRLVDVDGRLDVPGNLRGLLLISDACKGHACLLPMRHYGLEWLTAEPGWGLLDARSHRPVDPFALVTDEKIEMTDWELHDFGVQVVRDHIVNKLGFQLMSSQGNPDVDPSIWFVGSTGPEWVVVRSVRPPLTQATLPLNIWETAANCARLSRVGHFASVSFAELGSTPTSRRGKIWRGHPADFEFDGLVPLGE